MQSGIRCMLIRGGTSEGAYFLQEDLPQDVSERDDLLLRLMGSPDVRQIDGIGGAHPLTSQVAIVSRSTSPDSDVDFLFAQVSVQEALVDTKPNCGNILASVGPFSIGRGLVSIARLETRVRVRVLNTGTRAELVVCRPKGRVEYEGTEYIDGVPGMAAAIPINLLETAGSVCGWLFPTGNLLDTVNGTEVTCIDNGMPMVLLRAADFGFTGHETCAAIQASGTALQAIEAIRLEMGSRMNVGDVKEAVVPKMCLLSPASDGGSISTRSLIPRKCHESVGVFCRRQRGNGVRHSRHGCPPFGYFARVHGENSFHRTSHGRFPGEAGTQRNRAGADRGSRRAGTNGTSAVRWTGVPKGSIDRHNIAGIATK